MDWASIRDGLLRERETIEQRLRHSGEYGMDEAIGTTLGELSAYDNHPADIGSEVFERGKDLALRDRDRLRLQDIDRALSALEDGTYGICGRCSRPIPFERLRAYPTALLCVDCKRREEREHPSRQRPVEETVNAPAFHRSNLDGTEVVEFDGEDSWQAVARYNQRPEYEHDYELQGLDDNEGIVDPADAVSDRQYREQLP
ncbi:TraR/DksA C4-type zinc finger protein [Alicyclobacillus kakegawensis]|uniref:TraR/DksA C4-type zinc finger protein n=1 Tax=Alicyclobacillus kakegawensis TaxID=392012 RepID=UPI000833BCD6|nr:TraR/DksA C4-type zinc finger protein [Alicyclobacillus kakegawensis]